MDTLVSVNDLQNQENIFVSQIFPRMTCSVPRDKANGGTQNMGFVRKDFIRNLEYLMEAKDMTKEGLSLASGMSVKYIQKQFNEKTDSKPKYETRQKIAQLFGLQADDLFMPHRDLVKKFDFKARTLDIIGHENDEEFEEMNQQSNKLLATLSIQMSEMLELLRSIDARLEGSSSTKQPAKSIAITKPSSRGRSKQN